MLRVLDAAALRAWCESGRAALSAACRSIDDLNVFPVPDGDTGTNLLLTMEAAADAVRAAPADAAATARALAQGALTGARGNSGVILSQLLAGMAEVLAHGPLGAAELRQALTRAADLAYAAVSRPVEGTLLTVARAAADAAAGDDLLAVVSAARAGAERALARTPELLPALREAGVVDAGGRGWVVLLEALEAVVAERALPQGPPSAGRVRQDAPGRVRQDAPGRAQQDAPGRAQQDAPGGGVAGALAYEVQYLLRDAPDAAVAALRTTLGRLGDSVAVAGGDGLHNVHVHVDVQGIGPALEAGLDAGRPVDVRVTRFPDYPPEPAQPAGDAGPARQAPRAVLALVSGEGLAGLFRAAGATVLDAPTAGDPAAELLRAVLDTGAAEVVLLPNAPGLSEVVAATTAQAAVQGVQVALVPSRSAVQGLAALAVASPGLALEQDVAAMAAAAEATRCGAIALDGDGAAPSGVCGLLDGRVVHVGPAFPEVARRLLDDLLEGAELLTAVLGAGAPVGLGALLHEHVGGRWPQVQLVVVDGGQPDVVLLLGAE